MNKTAADRLVFSQLEIFCRSDRFATIIIVKSEPIQVFFSLNGRYLLEPSLYVFIVLAQFSGLLFCSSVSFGVWFYFSKFGTLFGVSVLYLVRFGFSFFNFCRQEYSNLALLLSFFKNHFRF